MATCTCRKCHHKGDYTTFPKIGAKAPWSDVECPKCKTPYVDTADVQAEVAVLGVAYMFGKHNFNRKRADANAASIAPGITPEMLESRYKQGGHVETDGFKKFTFPAFKQAFPFKPLSHELGYGDYAAGEYADLLKQLKYAALSSGFHGVTAKQTPLPAGAYADYEAGISADVIKQFNLSKSQIEGKPKQAYPFLSVWSLDTIHNPPTAPGIPAVTYKEFLNWLGKKAVEAVDHTQHAAGHVLTNVAMTTWDYMHDTFGWDIGAYLSSPHGGLKGIEHGQWAMTLTHGPDSVRFAVTVTHAMRSRSKAEKFITAYGGGSKLDEALALVGETTADNNLVAEMADPDGSKYDAALKVEFDKALVAGFGPVDPDGMTTSVMTTSNADGDVFGPGAVEALEKLVGQAKAPPGTKPPHFIDPVTGMSVTWGDETIKPGDIKFTPHSTVNIQDKPTSVQQAMAQWSEQIKKAASSYVMLEGDYAAVEAKVLAQLTGSTAAHLTEVAWTEACKKAGPNVIPSGDDVSAAMKTLGVDVVIDGENMHDVLADHGVAAMKSLIAQAVVAALNTPPDVALVLERADVVEAVLTELGKVKTGDSMLGWTWRLVGVLQDYNLCVGQEGREQLQKCVTMVVTQGWTGTVHHTVAKVVMDADAFPHHKGPPDYYAGKCTVWVSDDASHPLHVAAKLVAAYVPPTTPHMYVDVPRALGWKAGELKVVACVPDLGEVVVAHGTVVTCESVCVNDHTITRVKLIPASVDEGDFHVTYHHDSAGWKLQDGSAVKGAGGPLHDPTGSPLPDGWTAGVDYAQQAEDTAKQAVAMFTTVSNPLAPAPEAKPWVVACLVGPDYMAHPELPWTLCGAGDCDGDVVVWDVPKDAKPFMLCGVVFLDEDGGVQYSEFPHANAGPCVVVPAPGQSWTMKAPTNDKPVSHLAGVLMASLHLKPTIKKTKAARRAEKSKKKKVAKDYKQNEVA